VRPGAGLDEHKEMLQINAFSLLGFFALVLAGLMVYRIFRMGN
jgi:hypothetical protein